MQTPEETPQRPTSHVFIAVAAILIVALFAVGLYSTKKVTQNSAVSTEQDAIAKPTANPMLKPQAAEGSFTIEQSTPAASNTVGKPITFVVKADSNNHDVTDYDALVGFTTDSFTGVKATSAVASFALVQKIQPEFLAITGFKSLNVTTSTVWQNTQVFTLTVTPTKAGSYTFALLPNSGSSTSKFIDTQSHKVFPKGSSVTVEVR
jgi:hypothetical protein